MNEVGGGRWCANCNVGNTVDAAFCSYCGAALGSPETPSYGPAARAPASGWPTGQAPTVQAGYPQPQPSQPLPYAQQAPLMPYGAGPAPLSSQAGYQYTTVPVVAPQGMPGYAPQPVAPYAVQGYGEQGISAYYAGAPSGISVNVSPVINVQVPIPQPVAPAPPPIVVLNNAQPGPGLAVRALWFLFVGLWLGALATAVGWALCVGVVTLPIGLLILNRLPAIMTLRPATTSTQVAVVNGVTMIQTGMPSAQQPFLLRAVYFVLVGWWLSALWLALAWVLVALAFVTFGLTLAPAFLMFERTPRVLTLRNN